MPSIDLQHRRLVYLINTLHLSMTSGAPRATVSAQLAELIECTVAHFAFEERLFEEHRYPDREGHASQHERVLATLRDYQRKLGVGGDCDPPQAAEFLTAWLTKHILGSDRTYTPYLRERGVR